jgi:hypothetical protein
MKQFLSVLILLFVGCSDTPKTPTIDKAQCSEKVWMYAPMFNGKSGAVGSSRMHIKGRSEQRKLAISRALDELASQMGVNVKNITLIESQVEGHASSSSIETGSQHVANAKVNAYIKEVCHDTYRDEIFIWMVAK